MAIKRSSDDEILPRLKPIKGLRHDNFMAQISAEIAEKVAHERHARSFDPNRCHCPRCTVIGG